MEAAAPHWRGPDQIAWLERMAGEHDNLRAALEGSTQTPDGMVMAGRIIAAGWWFWHLRGYFSEGRRGIEAALARDRAPGCTRARARALHGAGRLAFDHGDWTTFRLRLEESVTLWRRLGDKRGLAWSLFHLGEAVDQNTAARYWLAFSGRP